MGKLNQGVALIGFQASGKTTLGKQLAECLQCAFVDTDQLIEQFHPSLSCREIFQQFGAAHFRDLESQVIASLTYASPFVLATGGGSLVQASNGAILKAHTHLIYLKTSADVLKRRIWQRKSLPAYFHGDDPEKAFAALYRERVVLYEKWADQTLEMDHLSEEEALKQLLRMMRPGSEWNRQDKNKK
jgi:shikimate kinase